MIVQHPVKILSVPVCLCLTQIHRVDALSLSQKKGIE